MGRYSLIEKMLDNSSRKEGENLPNDEFVAKKSTSRKIYYTLLPVLGFVASVICHYIEGEEWISISLLILSIGVIFLLPTTYSYKAYVNREIICEEYLIVFVKVTKEVAWKDIKYKKIITNTYDEVKEIVFYDENKKRLTHFDTEIVGFSQIVKMAKKGSIKEIK